MPTIPELAGMGCFRSGSNPVQSLGGRSGEGAFPNRWPGSKVVWGSPTDFQALQSSSASARLLAVKLPLYAIVGDRPVKAERTEDGGMVLLAFDWETGELKPNGSYLTKIFTPNAETDFVDKRTFERKVAELRAKIKK